LEYRVVPEFSLRAGFDGVDPGSTIGNRTAFGMSLNELDFPWSPSFDYAFMIEPYAPSGAHFFTLRLHLSK
jgi:hypothetical protein